MGNVKAKGWIRCQQAGRQREVYEREVLAVPLNAAEMTPGLRAFGAPNGTPIEIEEKCLITLLT